MEDLIKLKMKLLFLTLSIGSIIGYAQPSSCPNGPWIIVPGFAGNATTVQAPPATGIIGTALGCLTMGTFVIGPAGTTKPSITLSRTDSGYQLNITIPAPQVVSSTINSANGDPLPLYTTDCNGTIQHDGFYIQWNDQTCSPVSLSGNGAQLGTANLASLVNSYNLTSARQFFPPSKPEEQCGLGSRVTDHDYLWVCMSDGVWGRIPVQRSW